MLLFLFVIKNSRSCNAIQASFLIGYTEVRNGCVAISSTGSRGEKVPVADQTPARTDKQNSPAQIKILHIPNIA